MIQTVNKYPISTIFGIDEKVQYVIPKFQREYTWRKEDWENLINDILEEENHFLGSIICINRGVDVLEPITPLEVIDGQQRLTTLSLLYAAIYNRLQIENREDEEFKNEKINLKYRLVHKTKNIESKINLSFQNHNFQDYRAILKDIGIVNVNADKLPNLGNRRIYRAYSYFAETIKDYTYEKLLDLLNKINSALLVKIEVSSHSDAFTLFESLNNRGVPLSAIDLIKNKILGELDKKKIKSLDESFDAWKKIIENLTEDYAIQERFLRQYYNAFKYKDEIKVKIKGGSKATRSNLMSIFDKLIDKNPKFVLEEFSSKSNTYSSLINPSQKEENYGGLVDLFHVGASPAYIFLLYLLSEHPEKMELTKEVIKFLVKYFIRRNVTDFPNTRDLDTIFIGLIDLCEIDKKNISFEKIQAYLTHADRFQNIKIFDEKLRGNIYEENTDMARFILCKLEEDHFTEETKRDLWQKDDKGKFVWTIEHIFPEGENIPKDWAKMIANGDSKEAEKVQIAWVHKLGNLTITVFNSKLSNLSFEKKRDRKDDKENCIGYKNGLFLNKELADKRKWLVEDISDRTTLLVELALDKFKVNGENKPI